MDFPLQTRAAYLTPDRLENRKRLEKALQELRARSYNTVVIPALHDGTTPFETRSDGSLGSRDCRGCQALEVLAQYELTCWLGLDLLTAGEPGSNRFGPIASRNRNWLMRNLRGGFSPPARPDIPGLFCWTTLEFRRFVGNMLVDITESFPVDGVVLDIHNLPRTDMGPEVWMHLGYSCLQRLQQELSVDVEDFLTQPTVEAVEAIEKWEDDELLLFVENLKARTLKSRRHLPFFLLASIHSPADPFAPWVPIVTSSIVDSVFLLAEAEDLRAHWEALDGLMDQRRPFLATISTETDLGDLARSLEGVPANGFLVLRPGPLQRVMMPEFPYRWSQSGALETQPTTAAVELLAYLEERLRGAGDLAEHLAELSETYTTTGVPLRQGEANALREELTELLAKLRDGSLIIPGQDNGQVAQTQFLIDWLSRVLLLTPAEVPEF